MSIGKHCNTSLKCKSILSCHINTIAEWKIHVTNNSSSLHELHATIRAPSALSDNEAKVRDFCAKIVALVERNGTTSSLTSNEDIGYIYGSTPTVLDAQVLVFLGRIQDTKREYLLPEVLVHWINKYRKGDTWRSIVTLGDASTIPPHAGH